MNSNLGIVGGSKNQGGHWKPEWTVILAMVVYFLVFSTLSLMRYYSGFKGDPDVGIFDQSFYTTTRGMFFFNDFENMSHFGIHNSAVFILLLPIYRLGGFAALALLMTALLALGAWPLYLLARKRLSAGVGVCFALMYLIYAPLHGVNYDQSFHELGFAVAPLMFAIYFFLDRRYRWMWVGLLLAMICKEDGGFTVAFFGLMGLLAAWVQGWILAPPTEASQSARRRLLFHSLVMVAVGTAWVLLSVFIIIPHFRAGVGDYGYFQERYGYLGSSLGEVMIALMTRPGLWIPRVLEWPRISYLLEFVVPTAFLCLGAPLLLVPAIPTLAINMLSTFGAMVTSGSRYPSMLIPFFWSAAVLGLWRILSRVSDPDRRRRIERRWVNTAMVLTILLSLAFNPTPLNDPFHRLPPLTSHSRLVDQLAARIPPSASVSTHPGPSQRLSRRMHCYCGYRPGVDYILVDQSPKDQRDKWFRHAGWGQVLPGLISSGAYEVLANQDGLILLRRRNPPLPD